MNRRTKQRKMPWLDAIKPVKEKYEGKWIKGPEGNFWISSVYPDSDGGFSTMAYRTNDFKGIALKLSINELERNYTVV